MSNKMNYLIYICAFIFCIISAAVLAVRPQPELSAPPPDMHSVQPPDAEAASAAPEAADGAAKPDTFYVVSHDGIVCVYRCGENAQQLAYAISYIDLYSLDSDARKMLEDGVMLNSKTDVAEMIENLGS